MDAFVERLLPVARETGIRLAFHPNDPPLPVYRGVEQPFTTVESQQELLERYGSRGKIFNVHFRNVRGRIPKFQEVFQDDGDHDSVAVMKALHEIGFDGTVMADHLPGIAADMSQPKVFLLHGMPTGTRDVAHAWSVGYLRALRQATTPSPA